MNERIPPKLAAALLRWFGPHGPALAGDLLEGFDSGKSQWWYWRQAVTAIVLIQWAMIRHSMEAAMERAAAYLVGALALGGLTATLQGFGIGSSHWIAAAIGGPVTGLAVGVAVRRFTSTNLLQWTFWMSAAVLVITAMGAECAMCWFVGA